MLSADNNMHATIKINWHINTLAYNCFINKVIIIKKKSHIFPLEMIDECDRKSHLVNMTEFYFKSNVEQLN